MEGNELEGEMREDDILTALYCNARNLHAYMMRLEPQFFSERNRKFFELVQGHYKTYGVVPWKPVFETELTGSEKEAMTNILDRITTNYESRVKLMSQEYIRDKLMTFAKRCFIRKSLVESYNNFEKGNYDEIIDELAQINQCIIDNDYGVEYHDEDYLEERYDRDITDYIQSKFIQIDETIQGWHKKALTVIAGPANSGKTMYLINAVARQLIDGSSYVRSDEGSEWYNEKPVTVLYITLEIDKSQVGRRLDGCLTNTPVNELGTTNGRKALKELLKYCKDDLSKRIVIKEMPGYKTTPADIEACMRNLDVISQGELKPDIVVVDYLGLMMPNHFTRNMQLYEKGLALAVELRSLAQRYDVPFIVAAQTNRDSFSDTVGMDKISDSIGISQTADVLITINRNDELDNEGCVILYLAKSRFSQNGKKWLFKVNYDCQRVNDYINDVPENIVELLEGKKKKKKKDDDDDGPAPLPDGDRRRPPSGNDFDRAYGGQ
jgi:replicative DNA helicase